MTFLYVYDQCIERDTHSIENVETMGISLPAILGLVREILPTLISSFLFYYPFQSGGKG
jgi:hypothetical protein